ncbi:MAG: TrkA family potassium uptake protein, partial [Roseiflexaceae bacterium]|nr:TrkA family potassium uptake protein [Roseiflexaceae bacterium]
ALADELTQTVAFDATDEDSLKAIGIAEFATVIVAIADDFECNLMTTVLLKELGVRRVICKASSERQKSILLRVGADQVILPEHEAGVQLAYRLVSPFILNRLELEPGNSVSEVRAPLAMLGRTLDELGLHSDQGPSVLLIKGPRTIPAPGPDQRVEAEDVLVIIGPDEAIARLAG